MLSPPGPLADLASAMLNLLHRQSVGKSVVLKDYGTSGRETASGNHRSCAEDTVDGKDSRDASPVWQ
jgi:hypothetical protein